MATLMTTPLSPEPLPAYRRDPETDSVRSAGSAAPSYTSETPTYNSTRRQPPVSSSARPAAQSTGLPAPRYAPGFHRRPHGSVPIVESSWASVRSSHAARQYHAVASRRVSGPSSSPAKPSSGSASPVPRTATAGSAGLQVEEIISPLEDPHLVGEVAAAQARSARLHREACARGEEALNNEGKSWDFLVSQMTDWEEREKSWKKFRNEASSRRKVLGRRIGLLSSF